MADQGSGRRVRLTHPGKVLYPAADAQEPATKADVADYYERVAGALLVHAGRRPVTRMRWPDGVDGQMFVEKNLPAGAPKWLTTVDIEHRRRTVTYPIADSEDTLRWFAQMAALELHVPQWTLAGGDPGRTRRLVIDLDPGPDVDLDGCARVALWVRDLLARAGLESWPVTSGSKGIHVYARLPREVRSASATKVAREVAKRLSAQSPDEVTATMRKAARKGRVLIDWSQNNAAKTTVAPYSLRGRDHPWAAAPRTWEELGDGGLAQLTADEVLRRLETDGDLLAELAGDDVEDRQTPARDAAIPVDLAAYRRRRDRQKTPEPFGEGAAGDADGPIFVVQRHEARALHWDVRLERGGVLVSWAVPKGLPDEPGIRRLAVRTEDHPLDYADFSGRIPKGEYGAGTVEITDRGTITVEKWEEGEVLAALHGRDGTARYAFVRTGEKSGKEQWIVQRRKDDADSAADPAGDSAGETADDARPAPELPERLRDPRPMLATAGEVGRLTGDVWVFEPKWDGYRVMLTASGGAARVSSRNGVDLTDRVPGIEDWAQGLGLDVVLDGEMVVLDDAGQADFAALARREAEGDTTPVHLLVFDALWVDGTPLLRTPWEKRRAVLEEVARHFDDGDDDGGLVRLSPLLGADDGDSALAAAREQGSEGVVAKKRTSTYLLDRRSGSWRREAFVQTTEAVVGGWSKSGRGLSSLLLGFPTEQGLRYLGRVGTGFTSAQRDELRAELESSPRKRSPFTGDVDPAIARDARWVRPQLVVEVTHRGYTGGGLLRHASWRGIRRDKLPGDLW